MFPQAKPQSWARPETGYTDRYVLTAVAVLLMVYAVNAADRYIMAIVGSSLREEFNLTDTQFGLMTGLSFALFYSTMGIPFARWAERGNRVKLLGWAIAAWSAITVFCGLATGFWWLLLGRIGVAVGEAGAAPASHSLLADYVRPERRGTVFSIYAAGGALGLLVTLIAGGLIVDAWGWRAAFLIFGIPGFVLAFVVLVFLREPRSQGVASVAKEDQVSFKVAMAHLLRSKAFLVLASAVVVQSASSSSLHIWTPTFFIRTYDMTPGEVGVAYGFIGGIANLLGAGLSALIANRVGKSGPGSVLFIPAFIMIVSGPLHGFALFAPTAGWALALFFLPGMLNSLWYGPLYASLQDIVGPGMRATIVAVTAFLGSMVGAGLGPTLLGMLSDALMASVGDASIRWAVFAAAMLSVGTGTLMVIGSFLVRREARAINEWGPDATVPVAEAAPT